MIIFKSLFQKQTPEVQKALVGAAKEPPLTAQRLQDKQASIKNELVETSGTQIDPLDDADTWAEKVMNAVWPKFYDQVGGKDTVDEILRALERKEM